MKSQRERILQSGYRVRSKSGVEYIRGGMGTLIRTTLRTGKNTKRRCIV